VKKGIKTRPLRARSQPEATGKKGNIKTWCPLANGVDRIEGMITISTRGDKQEMIKR
jgi:hypothetical protein|tara:strand:- start:476 stop:646 length:171 start_codon:yes stop_codon:yes gene_type:complete